MNRAVGTGSPARRHWPACRPPGPAGRAGAGRHGDDPGAGREHGERGGAGHEVRQVGGVAVVDAREHPAVRAAGPWPPPLSGRTGPSVSQARRIGGNSRAQPRRRARSENRPSAGRHRWVCAPSEVTSVAFTPHSRHAQYCGSSRMSVTRAKASGEGPLLPVELGTQAQPSGRTGEPVAANGSSSAASAPALASGPDARSPGPAGPAPRPPSARPPPRAPPARCSVDPAPWPRARPAPSPPSARCRRGRAAGRAARAGRRRAATRAPATSPASSSRRALALVLPTSRTAIAIASARSSQEGRARAPPLLRSRTGRCCPCCRRRAGPAGSRCR